MCYDPKMARKFAAAYLLALGACSSPEAAPPPDRKAKPFNDHMEQNQKQFDAILEDVKQGRSDETIKTRLQAIRKNTESSQKFRTRPTPEETEEMDEFYFTFLLWIATNEQAEWKGAAGENLWKRLKFACNNCHARFRD